MKIGRKNSIIIRIAGFAFLLALMVVLNNSIDPKQNDTEDQSKTEIMVSTTIDGISVIPCELPKETRNSLPIKLVSNTQIDFVTIQNFSSNYCIRKEFKLQQKRFISFSSKLRTLLVQYIVSLANKDIQ